MTSPFSYSHTYILDKSHFSETFDASVTLDTSKAAYYKSFALAFVGLLVLLFTGISPYIAWFIVGIGALEAFSVRFQKAWWLARQMVSKAANGELTLTVNEQGISSKSYYVDSTILWTEIKNIEQTPQGWLLHHAGGKNYVSSRCLSDSAKQFVLAKAQLTAQEST